MSQCLKSKSELVQGSAHRSEETPKMIGALNELWVAGRSIEELSRDDKVLRRWQLAPGSLMLLRTILDSREGHAEFVSCGDSLQHSLSMLCVDLKAGIEEDDYYDDDFETDDDADSGVNLETATFDHHNLQAPWSPPEEAVSMSTSFSPRAAEERPQPAAVAPAPRQTIDTPPPLALGSSQRKLGLEAKQMLDSALDMPGRCSEERRELQASFFTANAHVATAANRSHSTTHTARSLEVRQMHRTRLVRGGLYVLGRGHGSTHGGQDDGDPN